jgi:tetratricopeptide (TPR) repeat protein
MRARPPRWFLFAALLLLPAGYLSWYGICLLRFCRDRAEAEKSLAEYDFAAARGRLAECVQLWPRDPATRLLAAQAARRDGDLDGAEQQLDAYRTLCRGPTPEKQLEWTLIRAERGHVSEVVEYLISCLDTHHPASEQILEALMVGCVQVYQLDRGRFWLEELQKKAPKNPIGRLVRAQTMESLGNDSVALEGYRALVADYPKYAKARASLAALMLRLRSYEEAAAQYEELRRQQPEQAQHLLGLVRCKYQPGRTEEARPLIRQLEQQHADNSEALLVCGQFALSEERPADAERLLRRAVALAPNDQEAHEQLGVCLQQLDRLEEARQHLERAKQIEADKIRLEKVFESTVRTPVDPVPRQEAGQICLRIGQTAEGLRWLYGALEVAPDHKPTHAALADYFAAQGNVEQAERHRQLAR